MEYYKPIKIEYFTECSQKDLFFLDKAIGNAYNSDFNSSLRLGACIALHKKKFFCGYNQRSRTQISNTKYHSLHAEIHALCNLIKQEYNHYSIHLSSCIPIQTQSTIYIARLMRDITKAPYGNSKPCNRCQEYMYHHNIRYVKYTDVDKDGKQLIITMIRQSFI